MQYDRFGILWIGDIEVLRTTTPEPNAEGISWNVQKDISIYANYIYSTKDLTATLNIPNNVSPTYTGIIYADVSMTIYMETEDVVSYFPNVLPLTRQPGNFVSISGTQNLTYSVSTSSWPLLSEDLIQLYVEIYASNHGCEVKVVHYLLK